MNRENAIEVKGLTKSYDGILAVDHIDFDVKHGEIFGFLGPNGAGKTTTIRILAGLSKPTEGSARVLGFDIETAITEAKKHIGVVPELSNLYEELSAADNLYFMSNLYGVASKNRKERVEQLLKRFRLYDRKDHLFSTFSRGMKRALTIAAALVHKPRLVFLDEPTVGLDVVAARSLRSLIKDLSEQGITVFLTTHYLEEADQLCDRVAILVKGQIVAMDSPQMLKASLKETPPMEISFNKSPLGLADELSKQITGIRIAAVNKKLRIYGGSPTEVLDLVLRFAKHEDVQIDDVTTPRPSLEDAFIKITGLAPTVMAIEKGGRR